MHKQTQMRTTKDIEFLPAVFIYIYIYVCVCVCVCVCVYQYGAPPSGIDTYQYRWKQLNISSSSRLCDFVHKEYIFGSHCNRNYT